MRDLRLRAYADYGAILGRQQKDKPIPLRAPGGRRQVGQQRVDLTLAQRLGLFSQSHSVLPTHFLRAVGRRMVMRPDGQYMPNQVEPVRCFRTMWK